ncbi:MAG: glutamine-hydrolyzing GMP synthase, partial [Acidobacteria bacterium]|nr:glutamine-hydrolyzing GMP synthase [Acidobacteriota bacterium]
LYKVEVRELGLELGVPRELVFRHPFPGPGLGVRLLCSTGEADRANFDEIVPALAEVAERGPIAVRLLPIRSVGVKADLRSYEHPVLLAGEASWPELRRLAAELPKRVPHVNRCLWWLGEGAPERFRPLAATVTRDRLDLLREADAIVMSALVRHGLYDAIWQCPTVLVPLEVDGRGRELAILRPVHSERAMTATPVELPAPVRDEVAAAIAALPGISGVALDLTTKPPGTIEWE